MSDIGEVFGQVIGALKNIGETIDGGSMPQEIRKQIGMLIRNQDEYLRGYENIPKYLKEEINTIHTEVTHIKCYKDILPNGVEYNEWIKILDNTADTIERYKEC